MRRPSQGGRSVCCCDMIGAVSSCADIYFIGGEAGSLGRETRSHSKWRLVHTTHIHHMLPSDFLTVFSGPTEPHVKEPPSKIFLVHQRSHIRLPLPLASKAERPVSRQQSSWTPKSQICGPEDQISLSVSASTLCIVTDSPSGVSSAKRSVTPACCLKSSPAVYWHSLRAGPKSETSYN
jgi:hypothetical protein